MRDKTNGDQREMQKTEKNVFTSNQFRLLRGVNKEMEELIGAYITEIQNCPRHDKKLSKLPH